MSAAASIKEGHLRRIKHIALGELAERIGAELHGGDPKEKISGVSTLRNATPGSVSFYINHKYKQDLLNTASSAVIMQQGSLSLSPVAALVVDNPRLAHTMAMRCFYADNVGVGEDASISATACVDPEASVGKGVSIGHNSVVEAGCSIADGVRIGPLCHVAAGVSVGKDSKLLSGVTLLHGTSVGERVVMHPGTVVGADGFGYVASGREIVKVPQVGGVVIGNDVEIGAGCTIDCGTMDSTVLEDSVKLDDRVHVGHNVRIGSSTIVCGAVVIGGSTDIGRGCLIGGCVILADNICIADGVSIMGSSVIGHSATVPGQAIAACQLYTKPVPLSLWNRAQVSFKRDVLDRLRTSGKGREGES